MCGRSSVNWERVIQVALGAMAVNLAYFTFYGKVEILASLLVCYVVIAWAGKWFFLAMPTFLFYQLDFTAIGFDYPISVVATCVATGALLRQFGIRPAIVASCLIAAILAFSLQSKSEYVVVSPPTVYVLLFLPAAVTLISAGIQWPDFKMQILEFIGRYPLSIYVAQYLILLLLSR